MAALWAAFSLFSLALIIVWCWLVAYRPRIIGKLCEPEKFGGSVIPSWLAQALGWFTAAAVCIILYQGFSAFFGWMPDSFGSLDRSGEAPVWTPLREALAAILAGVFTYAAIYASLHIAEIRANSKN